MTHIGLHLSLKGKRIFDRFRKRHGKIEVTRGICGFEQPEFFLYGIAGVCENQR